MAECFKFFDLKSRIMTSFDTVPLDIDFGHLLTGSNYSDRLRVGGGVGNVDDNGNNDRDNGLGGGWYGVLLRSLVREYCGFDRRR